MSSVREPLLKTVAILDLRPTQMTVGMREVKAKRKHWRDESKKKGEDFLGKHMIPVILGPKHRHYIIDHHHLARALHDEGVKEVAVTDVANLSKLDQDSFWFVMENRDWTHTFVDGRRRPYSDLPKSVDKLIDDPFRSLAGELRRAGGFAKDTTPFSEFLWADFLRRHMKLRCRSPAGLVWSRPRRLKACPSCARNAHARRPARLFNGAQLGTATHSRHSLRAAPNRVGSLDSTTSAPADPTRRGSNEPC
jgi:hypothetical protein